MKDFVKTAVAAGALYVTYKFGRVIGIVDTVKYMGRAEGAEVSDLKAKCKDFEDKLSDMNAEYEKLKATFYEK